MRNRPTRRVLASAAVIVATLALTSACGDEEEPPAGNGEPVSFDITFDGDTVTPRGAEETIAKGSDIELVVEADKPGELHVHSSPEQQVEYGAGTTTIPVKLANQAPGVVDIESHDLDQVVIRLTIR
ncbi:MULTISPECIES: fimbrillin family protein [Nocardioides]|uniref:Uncharacterized protein n=2 Tax=Nocardioides TaxID=1839 RepID=A0A1G6UW88_9ACTN|nr:fimbrillin family protein [Nocardioides lianchengensis]NYG11040.1 hypothetical protein [Nocardioides lianchengensis]SDD44936.1 hypothetical protein SAMN05421872_10893 [Nocardioides lianchengensis]